MNKEIKPLKKMKAKAREVKKALPINELGAHFQSLRDEMDHLVERFFGEKSSFLAWPEHWFERPRLRTIFPSIDVHENSKAVKVTAELPGLEEKDIQIRIEDGVLVLEGEKKYETEEKDDEARVIERRYGAFHRSFSLPASVDAAKARASFRNGVLRVTLPKTGEQRARARTIRIT